MASSQEAVIQELLFRLASVYVDRLTNSDTPPGSVRSACRRRPLRNAEDLVKPPKTSPLSFSPQGEFGCFVTAMLVFQINSCCHYGALYPWLCVLNPPYTASSHSQEALHKLQVMCPQTLIWNGSGLKCDPSPIRPVPPVWTYAVSGLHCSAVGARLHRLGMGLQPAPPVRHQEGAL